MAQATKHGQVFLFDRTNGNPLFPIEYRKYPASTVDGEVTAETQPMPTKPVPFARQLLTRDLLTNRTPEAHQWAVEKFETFKSDGQFAPFELGKDTIIFPGYDGGAEWGGQAFDPDQRPVLRKCQRPGMDRRPRAERARCQRARPLPAQCAACHGPNMAGNEAQAPSLIGIKTRLTSAQITEIIQRARDACPVSPTCGPTLWPRWWSSW